MVLLGLPHPESVPAVILFRLEPDLKFKRKGGTLNLSAHIRYVMSTGSGENRGSTQGHSHRPLLVEV